MGIRARLDNIDDLVTFAKALLAEIENGVEISLINTGEGTVLDFLAGKIKELPIQIKVKP